MKKTRRTRFGSKKYWEQRDRIWQRDKGKCQSPWCRNKKPWHLEGKKWDLDHVIPLSKGGTNDDKNLRVLCQFCHICRDDSNFAPTDRNSHEKLGKRFVITQRLPETLIKKYRWQG